MYISLYLSIFLSTRCRAEYHDSSRLCVQNLLILKRFIPRSLHHEAFIAKPISDDSSQQKSKQLLVVINAKNNFTLKGVHENLTFQNWTAEEPSLIQNFLNTHFLRVSLRECRLQSDTFKSWRHTTNCRSYLKRTSLTGKILFDTCMLSVMTFERAESVSCCLVLQYHKRIFWTLDSGTDNQNFLPHSTGKSFTTS